MQALSVGDTEDESAPAFVVEINEINSPRRIPPRGLSGTGIRILASGDPGNHPRRPLSLSLSLSLFLADRRDRSVARRARLLAARDTAYFVHADT